MIAFGDVSCDQAFEIDTTRVSMEVIVTIYRTYNHIGLIIHLLKVPWNPSDQLLTS